MRVTLLSMFSSSENNLVRYFRQVCRLRMEFRDQGREMRLILVEGDSKDDTWRQMIQAVETTWLWAELWQHHHGNEVYGSLEIPQRFAQLSLIWNEMLQRVTSHDDVVVIVESDLIWDADTMLKLICRAQTVGGIVAPMVFEVDTDYFHDVWAFRRNGKRFTNEPPYYEDLARLPEGLLRMDSVGSCMAMPGLIARRCRTTEKEELVGFSKQARANGFSVWCDPRLRVEHPPTGEAGRGGGAAKPVRAVWG